jgi:SpoVK/Ycf46/Vps4 family AAA+-type ATPase
MAAKRPNGHAADSGFYAGAKVEYYSKSYNEWIPCVIALVRLDGNLQLKHDDGTTLKDQADQSSVRWPGNQAEGGAVPPPVGGKAPALPRSPTLPGKPAAYPSSAKAAPSPRPVAKGAAANSPNPQRFSTPDREPRGRAASPAVISAAKGVLGGNPSGGPGGGAAARAPSLFEKDNEIRAKAAPVGARAPPAGRKASVAKESAFYAGDRAKIKSSGREGLILYVGTPSSSSEEMIGMQLDQKRSKADCDGKTPEGERLFRCTAGFGIFLTAEDIELLPADGADSFTALQAPPEPLDVAAALNELVGLTTVKQQLTKVKQGVEVQKKREALGVCGGRPLHFLFRGNHGTGMTKTAQLLAHLLRDLEVIASGQLIETSRQELLSGSSDVDRQMNQLWKSAGGGVLMVNDVQTLQDRDRSRDSDGLEASDFLAKQLNAMAAKSAGEAAVPCFPQAACIVLACQQDAVLPDPLQRSATHLQTVDFQDYSNEELVQILMQIVQKRKFTLSPGLTSDKLLPHVRDASRRATDPKDKNIHMLQRLVDEAINRQTERAYSAGTISMGGLTTLAEVDFVDSLTATRDEEIRAALQRLENIVGLQGVKKFIRSLHAQLKTEAERRDAGIVASGGAGSLHMIFSGNPGTGKTTVARIVADLLSAMGLLRKGHMVEADRASLVAGYSGQTAIKTKQVVDQAMGGVLFIDEAYALVSEDGKDSFGKEALDTLIKMIEDRREDIVVILAGYPDEMERLVATNPGVKSRFPTQVTFEDYSENELMQIAVQMLSNDGFELSSEANKVLAGQLATVAAARGRQQGNGRAVRNILEQARRKMAVRLQGVNKGGVRSKEELCTLAHTDFT